MDMKKILQAMDGAKTKAEVNSSDMKKFLTIVEGKGPLNRATAAESIAMQHYTAPKKTITSPVLNVQEGATPSMIGKYFKAVEQELVEAAVRPNERAQQLAERVSTKMEAANPAQQAAIAIAKKKKQGVAEGSWKKPKFDTNTVVYDGAKAKGISTFSAGYHPDVETAWIEAIKSVEPGAGAAMIKLFEQWAKSRGAKIIRAEALQPSLNFWKKIGYAVAGNPSSKNRVPIEKHIGGQGVAEGLEQYRYTDILEMARQGLSDEEIAEQLGFDLNEGLRDPKDNPCWKGYKPVGTKKKGGKTVPNCVPK